MMRTFMLHADLLCCLTALYEHKTRRKLFAEDSTHAPEQNEHSQQQQQQQEARAAGLQPPVFTVNMHSENFQDSSNLRAQMA
jgi:hypothetical protein